MNNVKAPVTDKEWKEAGERIRNIRENKNLTQEDVAIKAGITTSYFARIERGEKHPQMDVIKSIVKALNVKISDIVPF
ncbi:MAG TPA: helix-turn-helix transcriptional regulator [Methylomirabilota bacterium]|nr:helix-turn-helix transcriptional regulator [Methylomirabilota bacterium]